MQTIIQFQAISRRRAMAGHELEAELLEYRLQWDHVGLFVMAPDHDSHGRRRLALLTINDEGAGIALDREHAAKSAQNIHRIEEHRPPKRDVLLGRMIDGQIVVDPLRADETAFDKSLGVPRGPSDFFHRRIFLRI